MAHDYLDLVCAWSREAGLDFDADFVAEKIEFLTERLFQQYTPAKGPHPSFRERLSNWLDGVPDDVSKKVMLQLVTHIFFIGTEQFISLYQAAYHGPIKRWLVEQVGIQFLDPDAERKIATAISETWFCPVTDSMQISEFCHANRITGVDFRPDWCSLAEFGDLDKIRRHMINNSFKRVVLLEDFVGSGSQITPALDFAATIGHRIPFLVVPLIVCPDGLDFGIQFETDHPGFAFDPVLSLPANAFIQETPRVDEISFFQSARNVITALQLLLTGGTPLNGVTKPYSAFGYRKTGALVVMYTNTPDNTLPVIHWESQTWPSPIFPRSSRI